MTSPLLVLNQPSFLLTCIPTTFSWESTIPAEIQADITFQIHWVPSLQPPASPSLSAPPSASSIGIPPPLGPGARRSISRRAPPNNEDSVIVRTLVGSTTARSYDWSSVNIPEGVYFLTATVNQDPLHLIENSNTFPVYNGTDVSCLVPLSIPSGSGSVSDTVSNTASETGSFSTLNPPIPIPSNQLPVGASGSSTNVGPIVGGIVGGVVAIIILIIVALFLRRRRRHPNSRPTPSVKSSKSGKRGNGKAGEAMGNWKGLGSVDLHDPEGGAAVASAIKTARKESGSSEESGPPSLPYTPPALDTFPTQEEKRSSLSAPRKTARKPVPSYLNGISPSTPLPSGTNFEVQRQLSVSSNTHLPPSSPSSPIAEYQNQSYDSRHSSSALKRPLKNTYTDYPKDDEELQAEMMVANLQRSANHGEMLQMKPVHYLMPDLPLEQQHQARRS